MKKFIIDVIILFILFTIANEVMGVGANSIDLTWENWKESIALIMFFVCGTVSATIAERA